MTADTEVRPLPVEVTNDWRPLVKDRKASKSTLKTHVLDAANAAGPPVIQICDYEPTRLRMVVHVIDQAVALTVGTSPRQSPDLASAVGNAPEGRYLPPAGATATGEYVFYGPDAYWLNTLTGTTTTRVTVTKEYE